MRTEQSWGLVGPGNIGGELLRQVEASPRLQLESAPRWVMRQSGIVAPDLETPLGIDSITDIDEFPEVLFVALPSSEDGEPAFTVIKHALEQGSKVVTAEKGAMANHFSELEDLSDHFTRLGVNATVGGGTRLLEVARTYLQDPANVAQIHLAVNGTLTSILSAVGPVNADGMSLGQAVEQAVILGFAEPGADSPYDVIRGEAEGDIPKKVSIFMNMLGLSGDTPIDWRKFNGKNQLSNAELNRVVEEASARRYVVSIYPLKGLEGRPHGPEENIIGGFDVNHNGWRIVGGFRDVTKNPLMQPLARLTGPGNGFVIGLGPNETDGTYTVTGPGAGPKPTVNTMLDNYLEQRAE